MPSSATVVSASRGTLAGSTISLSGLDLADGASTQVQVVVDAACIPGSGFTLRTTTNHGSDADGVPETRYVGRLPDCRAYDADDRDPDGSDRLITSSDPCIAKRRRQPEGEVLVALRLPARAEDPRMR
ncbi:hypothetical protein [Baekduia soli]|uniref:hypothetical protein n=1 Tax=Baekduia soli TaxID=496014 RepID=UPI001651F109|nr:hypothetical protein [Baekduia soli]